MHFIERRLERHCYRFFIPFSFMFDNLYFYILHLFIYIYIN